jgi:hypothetical protein
MNRTAQWVLVLAALAASVSIVSVVDQSSRSVSDTLFGSAAFLAVIWAMAGIALLVLHRRNT